VFGDSKWLTKAMGQYGSIARHKEPIDVVNTSALCAERPENQKNRAACTQRINQPWERCREF